MTLSSFIDPFIPPLCSKRSDPPAQGEPRPLDAIFLAKNYQSRCSWVEDLFPKADRLPLLLSSIHPLADAPRTDHLLKGLEDKPRVSDNVAAPQTLRLDPKTEEPFQPVFHHPSRGLPHVPGMEIKGGADGKDGGGLQPQAELGHPIVLLRRAQSAPD